MELLGTHNMKEERVLYPAIDQLTSAEERENGLSKYERHSRGAIQALLRTALTGIKLEG